MINLNIPTLELWGIGLLITRFCDGYKYHIEANAIRRAKTAKGHSRKFINIAWGSDLYMLIYLLNNNIDWFMIISFIIALIFMTEHWITVYKFYPYKCRGLQGFKKPNLIIYLLNSLLPNKIRRRL
jgi:hypothetical protein